MNSTTDFLIFISKKDIAGMNIGSFLSLKIDYLDNDTIFSDRCGSAKLCIFATRHSSTGPPTLSVHAPGNWGTAEYGGKNRALCTAAAGFMKEAMMNLSHEVKALDYDISMEQTHHGPVMDSPCFFIEIGSQEKQWKDPEAAKALARTIEKTVLAKPVHKSAVFVGGGHYNKAATKVMLNSEYAIGHICARHELANLNEHMLLQAMEKTEPKAELVILDWKGLGEHKRRIVEMLENMGIEYIQSKKI